MTREHLARDDLDVSASQRDSCESLDEMSPNVPTTFDRTLNAPENNAAPANGRLPDDEGIAGEWVRRFGDILSGGDVSRIFALFCPGSWWRDLLTVTGDLRSVHGREGVAELALRAQRLAPTAFQITTPVGMQARSATGAHSLQAFFAFETRTSRHLGVANLVRTGEGPCGFQAATVLTAMQELIGHEEAVGTRRPHGGPHGTDRAHRKGAELRRGRTEFRDADPDVLIVGAGHSGLSVAARLDRMGVQTLVLDRNDRVGDNWRNRYDSLVLHDPVHYDHLPYLPFPTSWPTFTPKDKMGDWLEGYATVMDLDVWTGSALKAASWDEAAARWTVIVERAGHAERTLRPRHVVLSTGISGTEPHLPALRGIDKFDGEVLHSSEYRDGGTYDGRRVLVVGTGNSGHDIAQDLHEHGAQVTMLQRSETYVINARTMRSVLLSLYDEDGPPTEVADLMGASVPTLAAIPRLQEATRTVAQIDRDLQTGLQDRGFAVSQGLNGTGVALLYSEKGGGYYVNVGCSELIMDGSIAVKQGVEIDRLSASGVVYTDGTAEDVDVIVLATGYLGMLETARRLLGDDVVNRCGPVWGLDDEGELRSVWRRSGHPGLWFNGGNLSRSRVYSRFLARGFHGGAA